MKYFVFSKNTSIFWLFLRCFCQFFNNLDINQVTEWHRLNAVFINRDK